MKLNKLASAILRGTWLLDDRAADQYFPIAERFLAGERVAWFDDNKDEETKISAFVFSPDNKQMALALGSQDKTNPQNIFNSSPEGSIAVIPVQGALMQDDNCGAPGTETLSQWLMDAYNSPNIIGAVLKTNSPGGTVEGTDEFAQVIQFVQSKMPVEAFVNGQACSAALWAISPLNITASSGTVEIGSVGTAANYKDYSKGSPVVSHYITADESFDKNKDGIEALKGNYTPIKTNIINPTQAIFKAAMIANRGDQLQLTDVKDDSGNTIGQYPLTGQVYLAQKAIDLGLINSIGNMDSVIASVRARAESTEFSSNQNNNNMSLFGTKTNLKKLGALKGKKAAEITDAEIVAVNEELEAEGYDNLAIISTSHLEEANTNADAIDAGLTAINGALKLTGEKQHTTIATAITALVAAHGAEYKRAEAYGAQPGAKPTNPKSVADAEGEDTSGKVLTSWEQKAARKSQSVKTAKS